MPDNKINKKYYKKSMKGGASSDTGKSIYKGFAGKSCTNNTVNPSLDIDNLISFLEDHIDNILFNDTRNLYCYSKDLVRHINKNNIIYTCIDNKVDLSRSFIKAEPGKGMFGITSIPDNAIISVNNILKVILESPDKVFYIARTAKNKELQTISYNTIHSQTGGKLIHGVDPRTRFFLIHNEPKGGPVWRTGNEGYYRSFLLLIRLLHLIGRNAQTNPDGSTIVLADSRCTREVDITTENQLDTEKYRFTNEGTFGIGMEYKCSVDDNIYIAKAIFPVNRIRDIVEEIKISKRLATSGSPCIAQFLFAISFADRQFTSKNPGESMSLSVLYYMLESTSTDKDKELLNVGMPRLNHAIQKDTYESAPIGIISMEKGVNTLESISSYYIGNDFFAELYNYTGKSLYKYGLVTFIMELSLGFYYIQMNDFTHGDFKFDNCVYKNVKYNNVNGMETKSNIPMLIDLGLASDGVNFPEPIDGIPPGSWYAGAQLFRPDSINFIPGAKIPADIPHDKNLDAFALAKAMVYYIWQDGSYPLFDYANRDVFSYPESLLNIIKNMQSQDSKRRPKFKNIIEECFTYLRDNMTDKNSIFHVDNLCLKYLNHRGIQGGNRGDNVFYKKDNRHIFSLENYPKIILDHIERLYTPEPAVRSPPRASPTPTAVSPPRASPTPPFVTPPTSPLLDQVPSYVSAISSPQPVIHITPPESKNCKTDRYDIYEIFSEINPDNFGEHLPNQKLGDILDIISIE